MASGRYRLDRRRLDSLDELRATSVQNRFRRLPRHEQPSVGSQSGRHAVPRRRHRHDMSAGRDAVSEVAQPKQAASAAQPRECRAPTANAGRAQVNPSRVANSTDSDLV